MISFCIKFSLGGCIVAFTSSWMTVYLKQKKGGKGCLMLIKAPVILHYVCNCGRLYFMKAPVHVAPYMTTHFVLHKTVYTENEQVYKGVISNTVLFFS